MEEPCSPLISLADWHLHGLTLGRGLSEEGVKLFSDVKALLGRLYDSSPLSLDILLEVCDRIKGSERFGSEKSIKAIQAIIDWLRVQLLVTGRPGSRLDRIEYTYVVLDAIVKNCGYRAHLCVEKREVMKTLSLVARRLNDRPVDAFPIRQSFHVASLALDILQGWGEAFTQRRGMYPNIFGTYQKLKFKYKVRFSRPDFDPTRVPIFLGPVSRAERTLAIAARESAESERGRAGA